MSINRNRGSRRSHSHHWLVGFVLLFTLPLLAHAIDATTLVEFTEGQREVALKQLRAEPGPIRLTGVQYSAQISFPVSSRQRLSQAELMLYVTNSIALTPRSQMAVAVNGSVIGQIPFRSKSPETRARITIPSGLLHSGYNQITFSVAQHYTEDCEDPSSPELWSEIDTQQSKISFKVTPKSVQANLADLPLLMDKRLVGLYALNIATTGKLNNELVEAGGLVAQAASLARDYAPTSVNHLTITPPETDKEKEQALKVKRAIDRLPADQFAGDVVLLGNRDALSTWLDNDTFARAYEPLLAIFPFGDKHERFALVVTGADDAQVRQAAVTLAKAFASMPPTAVANIHEISATTLERPPILKPGIRHPLSDFGYRTTTRQGIQPQAMSIRFWVAADHFAYPNSKLNLSLHMAYGAGFGPQSVLNVFLNNHFEHVIRMVEPNGEVYYDYRIPIPISSLKPGWNELQFRPTMIPARAEGRCQPIYTDNLLVTVFDDSNMASEEMLQLTQLPDLKLLARTGFPFSGSDNSAPLRIALTGNESGNLSAAWTFAGKLAQISGSPLTDIRQLPLEQAMQDTLVVGQLEALPESLLEYSPLRRKGWMNLGRTEHALDAEMDMLASGLPASDALPLEVTLGNLLEHNLLLTQFESPAQGGHSVIMLLAGSPELLARNTTSLVNDANWGQLAGGSAVLGQHADTLRTYPPAEAYLVGHAGLKARLSHTFTRRPGVAIAIVVAGLLLFALISWRLLLLYRRRRHEGQGV